MIEENITIIEKEESLSNSEMWFLVIETLTEKNIEYYDKVKTYLYNKKLCTKRGIKKMSKELENGDFKTLNGFIALESSKYPYERDTDFLHSALNIRILADSFIETLYKFKEYSKSLSEGNFKSHVLSLEEISKLAPHMFSFKLDYETKIIPEKDKSNNDFSNYETNNESIKDGTTVMLTVDYTNEEDSKLSPHYILATIRNSAPKDTLPYDLSEKLLNLIKAKIKSKRIEDKTNEN